MLKIIAWYINIYIYNCFRKFLYLRAFVQAGAFDQKIEFLHHFIFRWIQRKVAKWTHPLPKRTFKWFEMLKISFTSKTNISLDLHIRGCKTMTWTATIQFQWKLPKELLTKSGWIKGIFFVTDVTHCEFLEYWNTQKSVWRIWQRFSCLLDEGISKNMKEIEFSQWLFKLPAK